MLFFYAHAVHECFVFLKTQNPNLMKRSPFALTSVLVVLASSGIADAATVGVNFSHGNFLGSTGIDGNDHTASLDAIADLHTPVWYNLAISDTGAPANGRGEGTFGGIAVSAYAANRWQAGSESVGGDNDASQQVFRVYLDDADGGNGFFNGDGIGASIHITGIQSFLDSVGATDYRLTVFYTSDNSPNNFPGATVRQGIPGAPSATAITDLAVLGTASVVVLGNGLEPNPSAGSSSGGTGGTRAWGELSGLTSSDITISMAVSGGAGNRAGIAGFAITAVPEPAAALLGSLGLIGLLLRRRA